MSYHLTVTNKPNGKYIPSFIDFFQDDNYYYLVMEYGGDSNLADFNKIAHTHLSKGHLKLEEWQKIIKFIFWYVI